MVILQHARATAACLFVYALILSPADAVLPLRLFSFSLGQGESSTLIFLLNTSCYLLPMINIYMKDAYVNAFRGVVKEAQADTGLELPESVECYVVMLLANNMDRPDFLPESTIAEAYLKLEHPSRYSAKELGDTCLFISGVFPNYKRRHGLNRNYYNQIGASSYDIASQYINPELFGLLSKQFDFVAEFIEITTSPEVQYKGPFR